MTAYYRFQGCEVGGSLHVVLDDSNIDDDAIEWCIKDASNANFWVAKEFYGGHDEAGELLGRLLLLMSVTQRSKLADDHDGYGHGGEIERGEFIRRCRVLLDKYQGDRE